MKLNLLHGEGQKMSGFQNISSLSLEDEEIIWCDVRNLDVVVDDGEVEVLIARNVINYMPQEHLISTLNHWVSKLRHGGRIVVGAIDLYEVARGIHIRDIELSDSNTILYGEDELKIKRNIFPTSSLVDFFNDQNMPVLKIRVDGYNMIVEAERP
ncbi:hypothetical protein CL634_06930 [bacterium]|nr:hypothetical protein [bacterium]